MMTTIHVVHAPHGGWDVKEGESAGALAHFDKQTDAVDYGWKRSQSLGVDLVIHRRARSSVPAPRNGTRSHYYSSASGHDAVQELRRLYHH